MKPLILKICKNPKAIMGKELHGIVVTSDTIINKSRLTIELPLIRYLYLSISKPEYLNGLNFNTVEFVDCYDEKFFKLASDRLELMRYRVESKFSE